MLEQILQYIRNWFELSKHSGEYVIEQGSLSLPFLLEGQYFRIVGSALNDGVYLYPAQLRDETFEGCIWALSVPKAVVDLSSEIEQWQTKNGETAQGPYQSESFGGYTYTKATDKISGNAVTWQTAFRSRLNMWRKL